MAPRFVRLAAAAAIAFAFTVPALTQTQSNPKPPAAPAKAKPKPKASKKDTPTLLALSPGRRTQNGPGQDDVSARERGSQDANAAQGGPRRGMREQRMRRGRPFDGDVRTLPQTPDLHVERPEREEPVPNPVTLGGGGGGEGARPAAPAAGEGIAAPAAPAPAPSANFPGLDFAGFGNGHPPDTNGDVGPDYFIQSINTSVGIFRKSDGFRVAAFGFNALMSQGAFGNVCDTNNFGDPVVLYDTFEDRWIITDFAFVLSGGNVVPPALQCFAVSKTSDPVAGGWNFFSVETFSGLGDYPKFGIWPDGLYMSANVFDYAAGGAFLGVRAFAFNKAQMYAGSAGVQVVSFDAPAGDFTILPSNARLQAGTPPAGTPNYFLSTWVFTNALTVYKFHVDWTHLAASSFTGPDTPLASTSWPGVSVPNAPSQGGNSLDVLQIRAMMQNQYSNIGGIESLWASHTVRRANVTGFAAPRWYQVDVTGGTVAAAIPQAATFDPDLANVIHRFMPSLAVDRAGNMALGYSTSSSTTKPAIKYAGRLAGDPINTFSQSEQLLIQGTGTQTGNCGTSACTRWGDYSTMTLDPDGCTFWYTNMYYAVDGLNHQTRIGSFAFPGCVTVGSGGIQGTVTSALTSAPLGGVLVALGTRTTTTDAFGFYSFSALPAGTYPSIAATATGYAPQSFTGIVVNEGATTTRNFALNAAAASGCFLDTTQFDFQGGVTTNCDLTGTPGSVTLIHPALNALNINVTNSGFGYTNAAWAGQTFTPTATGLLTRVDLELFCAGCGALTTPPNTTVSIRATAGTPAVPTGPDLAVATIAGFTSGAGVYYAASFASPITVTAGTRYAIVFRTVTLTPSGTFAYVVSGNNPYANGQRVTSANSGGTWVADTTAGGRDLGFKVYLDSGFAPLGTFVSSTKDANPAGGATPTWGNLTWNALTPVGTAVTFQAAASNNPAGPFNFVGSDGTAGTTFGNGASLSQFNGNRYLKYRATLTTTVGSATPRLDDVQICFTDVKAATSLAVDDASGVFGGSTTLFATLTAGGTPLAGRPIAFKLNGADVGTATTNGSGVATLVGVSLAGIGGGIYAGGVTASFAGELGYASSTGSATLTVSQAAQSITFGPLAAKTYGAADFTVSATASSGLTVSFAASGDCTVTGTTVHIVNAGACTITATQPGDDDYAAADPVPRAFSIARASLTVQADDKTKLFGAPNPPLTGTVTGVVGSDGITATYSTAALTGSPVGTYPIVPAIVDPGGRAGNYNVTLINGTLTIVFVSTGTCAGGPGHQVLPPVAADGSSTFNQGRAVPVKFRVCDATGASIGTPGVVQAFTLIQIITGSTTTNVSMTPESTNGDTAFRWDPADQQWIFNLSTRSLAAGKTYVYRIDLADGSAIEFRFALR